MFEFSICLKHKNYDQNWTPSHPKCKHETHLSKNHPFQVAKNGRIIQMSSSKLLNSVDEILLPSAKAQALPHGRAPHWWCLESYGFFAHFFVEKRSERKAGSGGGPKNKGQTLRNNITNWFPKFWSSTESTVCFWGNLKLGFHKIYSWGLFRSDVPYVPKGPMSISGDCWGGFRETSCFGNHMSWKRSWCAVLSTKKTT